MNLTYIKNYLTERKDSITSQDIEILLNDMKAFEKTEGNFEDISRIMAVIDDYNLTYLTLVEAYEGLSGNSQDLLIKKSEKVREILCVLSALHTYLVLSLSKVKDVTYEARNIRDYFLELTEKKNLFKSEKMTWAVILKNLTQELHFIQEMRKMDIEEKVGFIRN